MVNVADQDLRSAPKTRLNNPQADATFPALAVGGPPRIVPL